MRQLRREGWMHNRARLVVGSFLTKDLGIDWRWGERWFMRLLIDGDEANNNGNWQWIASVGHRSRSRPSGGSTTRRASMERFDPDGAYVRRYVPELARRARRVPAPSRGRCPTTVQRGVRLRDRRATTRRRSSTTPARGARRSSATPRPVDGRVAMTANGRHRGRLSYAAVSPRIRLMRGGELDRDG